jgi:hydroxymethylpyrimidine pyrophosphatase-like HAD family hydrolase
MDMNEWIATDLDSTLFHRSWGGEDTVAATWHDRAEGEGKSPSSWMRGTTFRLLKSLSDSFTIVPVTARDMDSFRRVEVKGLQMSGPAVIANGAIILDGKGNLAEEWQQSMRDLLAPWDEKLNELCEWLIEKSACHAKPRLVNGAHDIPAYLVAKAAEGWWQSSSGKAVIAARDWAGCRLEILGTELQILPPGVGKRFAVEFVKNHYFQGIPPTMCMGDMPLDMEFMRLGEFIAMPYGSELERTWV